MEAARVEAAQALLRRARLDRVLVNDTAALGEEDHAALLVGQEGVVARLRDKAAVAEGLADCVPAAADEIAGEVRSRSCWG